ncbi:MAG: hypothetical protein QG588_446, partial [Candidatus Poribacteria bacterium]|nr:hypothetical protein [Candidatus Poribacteria bacterium]
KGFGISENARANFPLFLHNPLSFVFVITFAFTVRISVVTAEVLNQYNDKNLTLSIKGIF